MQAAKMTTNTHEHILDLQHRQLVSWHHPPQTAKNEATNHHNLSLHETKQTTAANHIKRKNITGSKQQQIITTTIIYK